MQLLYNSDSYVVVHFQPVEGDGLGAALQGGYEIVDKSAGKEIYLQGAVAESFQRGVQALVDAQASPNPEAIDDFISGYTALAQHPVRLH